MNKQTKPNSEGTTPTRNLTVEIVPDNHYNPLHDDCSPVAFIVNPANRYFGGLHDKTVRLPHHEDAAAWLAIVPLYGFVHGTAGISTGSYACPWDSGQIGFVGVTKLEGGSATAAQALEMIESRVKEISHWLAGDFCGYLVKDEDGETIESCFGYSNEKDALEAAAETIKHLNK